MVLAASHGLGYQSWAVSTGSPWLGVQFSACACPQLGRHLIVPALVRRAQCHPMSATASHFQQCLHVLLFDVCRNLDLSIAASALVVVCLGRQGQKAWPPIEHLPPLRASSVAAAYTGLPAVRREKADLVEYGAAIESIALALVSPAVVTLSTGDSITDEELGHRHDVSSQRT